MGFTNQSSQQAFPASVSDLYEMAIVVLQRRGFDLVSADPNIWRIRAKSSLSALSWGENIVLSFAATGPETCLLTVESSLKIGISWTGTHRNQKNIEIIIAALSAAVADEARARELRRTAWKLPEESKVAPAPQPKRIAGYNYRGVPIDEFEDGTYVLRLGRGPERFATKDDLNSFLRRNFG